MQYLFSYNTYVSNYGTRVFCQNMHWNLTIGLGPTSTSTWYIGSISSPTNAHLLFSMQRVPYTTDTWYIQADIQRGAGPVSKTTWITPEMD